ncbi:LysR family transcriptional regulator [Alteromonas sp. D210916BOD_24]|uniref:LysR family transcriptional regulator n=1 Tax=Alteromonas sp. D210916BOD_24 TaxID=3157618 RepID=UPI00399C6A04
MDRFDMLMRFKETARLGSFSGAAQVLGVPKSSVSQSISQLESQLGTRLLHRSTRSVRLTVDGETFLPQCQALLADWEALESQFISDPSLIAGELRIDMPSRFATYFLLPRLHEFISAYPHIKLKVSSVDHQVNLVKEGFDCVIRVGDLHDSSLIAKPLFTYAMYNCVSTSYARQYGVPQSLDDLTDHSLIEYSHALSQTEGEFEYFSGNEVKSVIMPSVISVNSTEAYYRACINGLGIAQIPMMKKQRELDEAGLISVLPQFQAKPMPVNLLYISRRHMPKRLSVFIEWLQQRVEEDGLTAKVR